MQVYIYSGPREPAILPVVRDLLNHEPSVEDLSPEGLAELLVKGGHLSRQPEEHEIQMLLEALTCDGEVLA